MYNKPEVTKLVSSLEAIQSGGKNVPVLVDNLHIATPNAYEADE